MPALVLIETSTNVCSVAIGTKNTILAENVNHEGMMHATLVAPFVAEVMEAAKKAKEEVVAVAVSCGPGSYTGLRIGVSLAKGICFGRNIPLIAVSTMELIASMMRKRFPDRWLCPMVDARRMEVYTALYDEDLRLRSPISAKIITGESFSAELDAHPLCFGGNGAVKCKTLISHPNALFVDDIVPLASEMNEIAQRKYEKNEFEDVAYFEPFYLKNFIATVPKNRVLSSVIKTF